VIYFKINDIFSKSLSVKRKQYNINIIQNNINDILLNSLSSKTKTIFIKDCTCLNLKSFYIIKLYNLNVIGCCDKYGKCKWISRLGNWRSEGNRDELFAPGM